jgi:hypothetical protein
VGSPHGGFVGQQKGKQKNTTTIMGNNEGAHPCCWVPLLGPMFPLQPWLGLRSTSRAPLGPLTEKSLLKTPLDTEGFGGGGGEGLHGRWVCHPLKGGLEQELRPWHRSRGEKGLFGSKACHGAPYLELLRMLVLALGPRA